MKQFVRRAGEPSREPGVSLPGRFRRPAFAGIAGLAVLASCGFTGWAQTPAQGSLPPSGAGPSAPHRGTIVIQSHANSSAASPGSPAADPHRPEAVAVDAAGNKAAAAVTDADREAFVFTRCDLDARLDLERTGLAVRARVWVRNDSREARLRVPLQVSSTLRWESATLVDGNRRASLPLAQHRVDTDTDHTAAATEAVLTLPSPLPPGAEVALDLFYSGTVAQSAERLARLGASAAQGQSSDWDAIGPEWTGLRGFGDVLWYPVASPQYFLADGNTLFTSVGRMRRREEAATVSLRLSVAYRGEAPAAAYFCGRRAALTPVADDPAAPAAMGSGIATGEFPAERLGFRMPTLFVTRGREMLLEQESDGHAAAPATPVPAFSSSNPDSPHSSRTANPPAGRTPGQDAEPSRAVLAAVVSADAGVEVGLGKAAGSAGKLLEQWMGPKPLSVLTVLDHAGQPFQDGPLLVAPAALLETSPEQPALVYSLTHAWVQTGQPWMDEGLAQFFALLSVERDAGREAALNQLNGLVQPVGVAEPDLASPTDDKPGQPLITSTEELFYRRKAAAVWWMLRDLAGEQALAAALRAWCAQPASADPPEAQALRFEHLLEQESGKDLRWLFADWVLRDRGLPDLSIADVATSQTPAGQGHGAGWLVAVTVRNEGAAAAEVPVVVRSGDFSTTSRIRVAGFAQATERVLVESPPTEVMVNDGSTPELRVGKHTRNLRAR